jgi:MFS family permease
VLLQSSRVLSVTALEMLSVAVGWQVYEITHRPLDLGLIGLAQFLPGVLLFLASGHASDRFPRKRILVACYCSYALCAALLLRFTLGPGPSTVLPIYLTVLLIGVVRAFEGPARQAIVPELVSAEHFPNAVAWGGSVMKAAQIAGPALGGIIYAFAGGPAAVYGTAFVAYLGAVTVAAPIVGRSRAGTARVRDMRTLLAGLRYIRENKLLLGSISLDLFAVLLGGAVALLPVYARDILRTGPWGLGLLRAAPGVGAVLMGVVVARWPLRRNVGAVMLWCVAGFGVFTVVFAFSRSFALSLVALGLTGAMDMVSVIIRQTLVQTATPDAMRGRVSAVNMLFIGASNELGQFESGVTAAWFGTVAAAALGGFGTLAVVALWAWMFPQLRKADQLIAPEVASEIAPLPGGGHV